MKPSWREERALWRQGYESVAGVDEVGRGAWAGPVVAAAVVVTPLHLKRRDVWSRAVRDSKVLTPKARQRIFIAWRDVVVWSVGVVNNKVIDAIGIAAANKRALAVAVSNLPAPPQFVLADYVARLGHSIAAVPARAIINGDASVFSIALASIFAKVQRDALMQQYDRRYAGYGFAAHKGYGTRLHQCQLRRLGPCPLHRRSYRPVAESLV